MLNEYLWRCFLIFVYISGWWREQAFLYAGENQFVEEIGYNKMKAKPQLRKQHVHFKPESYIGSFNQIQERTWIIENDKPTLKVIAIVPAILKLCEEIFTNAAQHGSSNLIQIVVSANGFIHVVNQGAVTFEKLAENPTPLQLQAVFGEEDIGSELYRKGRGAKLVNMFSTHFIVEIGYQKRQEAIRLEWKNCLSLAQPPQTVEYKKIDYTRIKATLDLHRFRMNQFSQDFIGLLERRAWDIAALYSRKVIFNNKTIIFKEFQEYASKFIHPKKVLVEQGAGWRVAMGSSEHGFQQLSFVNGCYWTRNGGSHVGTVVSEIATKALYRLRKRVKDPSQIMQYPGRFTSNYMLIIDVRVQQLQFNCVTKDVLLSTKIPHFRISQTAINFLDKQESLKAYQEMAQKREINKRGESLRRENFISPRLQDAGKAGNSSRCTLLIVQNDATRQLMTVGLQCVNRDYFGIYTLKGKPPNARQAKNASEYQDFIGIAKALGLSPTIQSVQSLRYSSVLIVTDQDKQGVSIKGLLLNYFQYAFPWTLKTRGFVKTLMPPVVRVVNSVSNVKQFLSEQDFKNWSSLNSLNEWIPTLFGSISAMDPIHMRHLFADRKKYIFSFVYQNNLDEQALTIPYSADLEAKKKWLYDFRSQVFLDYNMSSKTVPLRQFVDRELAHVFYNQIIQPLPSVIDGLTIMQRKALACLFQLREGQQAPIDLIIAKVQQEYGQQDAQDVKTCLIQMGQTFVGANNLSIVEGLGQFGSRGGRGKDYAPSRHLRVKLPSFSRLLFPLEDDDLLQYSEQKPLKYVPILPLLLINGFNKSSKLWKSFAFPHRVTEVIQTIRQRVGKGSGKSSLLPLPGWQGFKGSVTQQKNYFVLKGSYDLKCTRTVLIKEISPFQGFREYRASLELRNESRNDIEQIKQEQNDGSSVLVVRFKQDKMPRNLEQYLQLNLNIYETPSMLINSVGKLKKYTNIGEIIEEFFEIRMKLYQKRKEATLARLQRNIQLLSEKIRFIRDVIGGQFALTDSEQAWRQKFIRKGYRRYQDLPRTNTRTLDTLRDFQHLERMSMDQFSQRKIGQLRAQKTECQQRLAQVRRSSEREMWLGQIAQFQERWRKTLRQREQANLDSRRRAENAYRQSPSEPSLPRNNRAIDFQQISLDSKACAELEESQTQGISEQGPKARPPKPKINGINVINGVKKIKENEGKIQNKAQQTKVDILPQRKAFQLLIREMQRKNMQFQRKMQQQVQQSRKDAEKARKLQFVQKQRQKQLQRAKRQELQQHIKQMRERETRIAKDKAIVQKEANMRRQILGRSAMELGKKLEQQKRNNQQKDKSEKSSRNHLPSGNGNLPRITVPFQCDSSNFMVTHVERKRFSTKDAKIDQVEINRIHEDIRRQGEEQEQRARRNNTCIQLD